MRVSSLIDENRREWKQDMIEEIFQSEVASMIMAIPLSKNSVPDKLIWGESVIGNFSVKLAYFKVREYLGKEIDSFEDRTLLWKAIWRAKVIPKVSMFAWRLVHNIIPSVGNLRRRGIQIDDRCCICGEFGETVVHVMLKCRFCKEVWAMVYPKLNEIVNLNLEWGNIWHVIFQQIIKDDYVEIFLTTCWMLWNNRNKCFHDN